MLPNTPVQPIVTPVFQPATQLAEPIPVLDPNGLPGLETREPISKARDKTVSTQAVKRLFIPLGILLLLLVGYNLFIHRTARSTYRHHLLTSLSEIPLDTDFLFLGNSLVEAGCDTSAFRDGWPVPQSAPKPVNIALGATSPVEHYLILKQALARPFHPKYLIYGFFDDQLCAPARGDWADLVGNRAFSYYFPDEAAGLYAPGSLFKKWQLR